MSENNRGLNDRRLEPPVPRAAQEHEWLAWSCPAPRTTSRGAATIGGEGGSPVIDR